MAELDRALVVAVGVAADAKQPEAAKAMIKLLQGAEAAEVLKRRGMERPPA